MSMQIVITGYGQHYQTIPLTKDRTILGRSQECDVPLNDRNLSRQHVEILQQNGQVYVRDLGSTNGTKLGIQPLVAQQYALWSTTSPLILGDYTIRLESIAASDVTSPFVLRDPEQTDVYQPVAPASYEHYNVPLANNPVQAYHNPASALPTYGQGGAYAAAVAAPNPLTRPKPAQSKGCMAFLDAFLKVSEIFSTFKYMTLFLLSPVQNTMLVVDHHEGKDVSAYDVHSLREIEPYKFLASGFGLYVLLLATLNFILPNTVASFDEFTTTMIFAGTLLVTITSSYFVFRIGTGSKRGRDSYMIMSAIMTGVQLAAIPVLFLLLIFAFFAAPLYLVLLVLYFYIYLFYYYRLQKAFWRTGYIRAVILSMIASIPGIFLVAVVSLYTTPTAFTPAQEYYYPSTINTTNAETITLDVISGGGTPSTMMFGYSQCVGDFPTYAESYWHNQYWYELSVTGMGSLQFSMTSNVDTVLVVQDPSGILYCNDDMNGLNPAILIYAPMAGRYNMWVGNFTSSFESGRLTMTVMP